MKLYLAGPLFTLGEKWQNRELAAALRELGYDVFLPQEKEFQYDTAEAIFKGDVAGMDWADAIIACIDGPDPDSGTSWELGYMYAKGKPALLYRTDFRTACGDSDDQPVNLMLSVAVKAYVPSLHGAGSMHDPQRLAVKIHEVIRQWPP